MSVTAASPTSTAPDSFRVAPGPWVIEGVSVPGQLADESTMTEAERVATEQYRTAWCRAANGGVLGDWLEAARLREHWELTVGYKYPPPQWPPNGHHRWDPELGRPVPDHSPPEPGRGSNRIASPESAARSERRRVQRAAERRRRAARKRRVRRCKCGCGMKIPPEADPRRKFYDDGHKDTYYNRPENRK